MRIDRAIVIGAALAVLALGLGAKDEKVKIGVVDIEQAISSTDAGRAAREEMSRKQRELQAQLQPLMETYQEKVKELEAKQFVLSEDALYQKRLDLAELQNEIQSKGKEAEGQLKVSFECLVGPLQKKLGETVEEVGRDNNFSLILRRDAEGLIYTREALDITDLVIEKFNKKS